MLLMVAVVTVVIKIGIHLNDAEGGVILSAASTGSSRAFVFCVNFVIYPVM